MHGMEPNWVILILLPPKTAITCKTIPATVKKK